MATWRGFSATTVRTVFVVVTLITQGTGIALYVLAWLLLPSADGESIAARARSDTRGIALATALGSMVAVLMMFAALANDGVLQAWGWPQVISVGGLVLIWRNAPAGEREHIRRLVEPLDGLPGVPRRTGTLLRLVISAVLLIVGLVWMLTAHEGLAMLRPLVGVLLVVAAIATLLGPWWLRVARDLVLERQARVRAEERAEIATRVHDSVLQTLALIQRRADDPQQIVKLARAQERELRSWLFEGKAPGQVDAADMTFATAIRQIQQDVEARYGTPVEAVMVGDCQVDEPLSALLAAAREAAVNAAKWSGASVISLFAEVEAEQVQVVVRDRGRGFDPAAVPADRKGLAESVRGRMARHGGHAVVHSAPGEGTKVTLTISKDNAGSRA